MVASAWPHQWHRGFEARSCVRFLMYWASPYGDTAGLGLRSQFEVLCSGQRDPPGIAVRPSWVGGVSCDSDAKRANVGLRGRVSGSRPVQESWGGVDRAGEAAMQHR